MSSRAASSRASLSRGTSLSRRSSPVRRPSGSMGRMYSHPAIKGGVFTVAALVFLLLVILISHDRHYEVHSWAHVPLCLSSPATLATFVGLSVVAAAFSTGFAFHKSQTTYNRFLPAGLFMALGGLLVALAFLIYRSHSFNVAFWVALLALALSLAHMHFSMLAAGALGAALGIPLVLLFATAVYYLWFMADESACLDRIACATFTV